MDDGVGQLSTASHNMVTRYQTIFRRDIQSWGRSMVALSSSFGMPEARTDQRLTDALANAGSFVCGHLDKSAASPTRVVVWLLLLLTFIFSHLTAHFSFTIFVFASFQLLVETSSSRKLKRNYVKFRF